MGRLKTKKQFRHRRHLRLRNKIKGTAERPRMAVFRSLKHIYVQFVDDDLGHTLCAVSTRDKEFHDNRTVATLNGVETLGRRAGETAKEKGITKVVFDCGGFTYGSRIKKMADAARAAGLEF